MSNAVKMDEQKMRQFVWWHQDSMTYNELAEATGYPTTYINAVYDEMFDAKTPMPNKLSASNGNARHEKAHRRNLDMIGQHYGQWTVIGIGTPRPGTGCSPNGAERLLCRCSCGKERNIAPRELLNGNSKSCGCRRPHTGRLLKELGGNVRV